MSILPISGVNLTPTTTPPAESAGPSGEAADANETNQGTTETSESETSNTTSDNTNGDTAAGSEVGASSQSGSGSGTSDTSDSGSDGSSNTAAPSTSSQANAPTQRSSSQTIVLAVGEPQAPLSAEQAEAAARQIASEAQAAYKLQSILSAISEEPKEIVLPKSEVAEPKSENPMRAQAQVQAQRDALEPQAQSKESPV